MNQRPRKRRTSRRNTDRSDETKRPPAYKRQPELYFTHVWLDKEIFSQVVMFIGWEKQRKYSIKTAVRILLQLGLKKYIIDQTKLVAVVMAQAKGEGREPPEQTPFVKYLNRRARQTKIKPRFQ